MEIDSAVALPQRHTVPVQNATQVHSGLHGTTAAGALCTDCVKLTVDISEGIPREATLHTCRDCERWLQPPIQFVTAALESREMLALCLRKLKGLSKVRIIDAHFLWTEPHSRRIKVKITIQQEALQGTILQQTFEVEYVVNYHQCPDCAKSFTANTWRACVQVRQKVPHKRTFLHLEQLVLKHSAHKDAINIRESHEGLDFFFSARNHAEKFVDFLNTVAPIRTKKAQELISMDIHTSTKSYKFTYSCELIPVCKDDLVALPMKLARQLGNISPLVLCYRVATFINVVDPSTMQSAEISTPVYWRTPFATLADSQELTEYMVMDIEMMGKQSHKFQLAEVTVARMSDISTTFFARTHLGGTLRVGDSVMGYHLTGTNFNNPHFEAIEQNDTLAGRIPDVILVKKVYVRSKKNKGRNWRLKRMNRDEGEMLPRKQDQNRMEQDYEMFLRDVEEDPELRATMALYKQRADPNQMEGDDAEDASMADESEEGDGLPGIDMGELLDDFDELGIQDHED